MHWLLDGSIEFVSSRDSAVFNQLKPEGFLYIGIHNIFLVVCASQPAIESENQTGRSKT